jgi:hypothetical protein
MQVISERESLHRLLPFIRFALELHRLRGGSGRSEAKSLKDYGGLSVKNLAGGADLYL